MHNVRSLSEKESSPFQAITVQFFCYCALPMPATIFASSALPSALEVAHSFFAAAIPGIEISSVVTGPNELSGRSKSAAFPTTSTANWFLWMY